MWSRDSDKIDFRDRLGLAMVLGWIASGVLIPVLIPEGAMNMSSQEIIVRFCCLLWIFALTINSSYESAIGEMSRVWFCIGAVVSGFMFFEGPFVASLILSKLSLLRVLEPDASLPARFFRGLIATAVFAVVNTVLPDIFARLGVRPTLQSPMAYTIRALRANGVMRSEIALKVARQYAAPKRAIQALVEKE